MPSEDLGEIKRGDVAIDLVKRGKVQIVGLAAETVEQHRVQNDYDVDEYKANALLDVDGEEPVYSVVFLPDEPSTSFSGTYDMPRSRLARCPVEEANGDLRRFQNDLAVSVLEALFGAVGGVENVTEWAINDVASHAGIDEDLVDEARELADVDARIGEDE